MDTHAEDLRELGHDFEIDDEVAERMQQLIDSGLEEEAIRDGA